MRKLLFGRTKSNLPLSVFKVINILAIYILLLPFVYKTVSIHNPQIQHYSGVLFETQLATKHDRAAHPLPACEMGE